MPIALQSTPISLPPDLVEVRAGDLDGDGRAELVLIGRTEQREAPATITLTGVHFDAAGAELARQTLPLGNRAQLWDIQEGLWIVDGQGVASLGLDGKRSRVAALDGLLTRLGPTTPLAADIAQDLDRDGVADILVYSGGAVHAFAADGRDWGAVTAAAEGGLHSTDQAGGTILGAAIRTPSMEVGDVDGDGRDDLLLPRRAELRVAFTGARLGEREARMKLPLDLAPPKDGAVDTSKEQRRIARSWFRDLDGDGKVDLLVHTQVSHGSWFGATAELMVARGTGQAFLQSQVIRTQAAAIDPKLVDVDGDGDLDLLVPQIDLTMGNLASALVSHQVKVDATLYRMQDGRYLEPPITLRRIKLPVDNSDTMQLNLEHDVDGDGIIDMVSNDGEDAVRVYAGSADAIADTPLAQVTVKVPPGHDTLFVQDLTGDGRVEILVWGPHQRQGTLLRLP